MTFKINGQKIKILRITKYLGLLIDEKLSFKLHLDTTKLKLNRANCLLSKIRHCYSTPT